MFTLKKFENNFYNFGLLIVLILTFSTLLSIALYVGTTGSLFDVKNQYISELGEISVYSHSYILNYSFIVVGLFLIPFFIGLNKKLKLNIFFNIISILTALFFLLMGVFPINVINRELSRNHNIVSTSYFIFAMISLIVYTAYFRGNRNNHWVSTRTIFLGIVGIALYVMFILSTMIIGDVLPLEPNVARPDFIFFIVVEWLVYLVTILWMLSISIDGSLSIFDDSLSGALTKLENKYNLNK